MKIEDIDVGSRIRAQRKRRKLSLNQLASMTGIAASNLSSIELNKSSPTLGTLSKIATAFDMKISSFVDDIFYEKVAVCIPEPADMTGLRSENVTLYLLTGNLSINMMDATTLTFQVDSVFDSHENSERFLYCVQGLLEALVGQESYEIKKNRGIYLMPEVEALIRNKSDSTSFAIMISRKNTV